MTRRLVILPVLALFSSVVATGQSVVGPISEAQAATRAAPTATTFTTPTTSLSTANVNSVRVSVCAEAGATLTGGTLKAYQYDPNIGTAAMRIQRNADRDLRVGSPGTQCRVWPDLPISARAGGRLVYATNGMTATLSDAGTYTDGGYYLVQMFGWTEPGGANSSTAADGLQLDTNGNVSVSMADSHPSALDLNTTTLYQYYNCASGGGVQADGGSTIPAGTYLLTVADESTRVCYAATCASGGVNFLAPFPYVVQFDAAQSLSCRSTSSTGDLELTPTQQ